MHLFSIDEFTWEDITQYNRNPLLGLGIGANGMKTGHTQEAGYGLVASVEREGRKVVAVVAGLETPRQRAVEAEKLVNWAYREFRTGTLFAADEAVAEAEVWIGERERVGLAPREDVVVTVPFSAADQVRARLHYDGPVPAPITAGQEIGELIVEAPDMAPMRHPLVAMSDVAEGGALARVTAGAELLLRRLPLPGRPE
jgi:D-alanyl-D-alanine carboxypeptidase (penicillin-binding protein 5/6)